MKNMREMINLMEGVMAVPGIGQVGGSESDMQTSGTVGRDASYSEFDSAQPQVNETEMSEVLFRQSMDRLNQLSDSFVSEEESLEILASELEQQGVSAPEIAAIMAAVEQEIYPDVMDTGFDGPNDMSDDAEALASAGHGSDEDYGGDDFPMEEAFDMQNGYNDVAVASGNDYFPNGADSPVVKAVGPSGARQGDNPEQKKMQVDEVHKELVYGYRNFLKESAATKKKS